MKLEEAAQALSDTVGVRRAGWGQEAHFIGYEHGYVFSPIDLSADDWEIGPLTPIPKTTAIRITVEEKKSLFAKFMGLFSRK